MGVTIQGTGNDTVVKVWKLGASPSRYTPYDKDNWESSDDAADVTMTNNPSTAADTGKQVGIGFYWISGNDFGFDNWYGGDTE